MRVVQNFTYICTSILIFVCNAHPPKMDSILGHGVTPRKYQADCCSFSLLKCLITYSYLGYLRLLQHKFFFLWVLNNNIDVKLISVVMVRLRNQKNWKYYKKNRTDHITLPIVFVKSYFSYFKSVLWRIFIISGNTKGRYS